MERGPDCVYSNVYRNDMAPLLELDAAIDEPIYGQIAARIRERILRGDLRTGHRLPAVRTLASDLGVSLNTVARAYRRLDDEGFVRIVDRVGVEVTAPPILEPGEGHDLRRRLRADLAALREAGLEPRQISALVEREIERLDPPNGGER